MIADASKPRREEFSLIDLLLEKQQITTTAVDRFSELQAAIATPAQAKYYRDLIPLARPAAGEQYAFEVDLDNCSGCKACVTACHNLNGLEETETWRSVGLLHGGSDLSPILQHVTTACHHCVEPACLSGCPVNAYAKDAVTGIVRHLDDQCIGCQYCILKCPYDVPKYSKSKGIVRKCDMCSNRLAVGEAPACVQACPNQAIAITVIKKQTVIDESEANMFLPGAPEPSYTLPATIYKTTRQLPRNLLPADYYAIQPEHAHFPLVFMLVLTQMSVGAFAVQQLLAQRIDWFSDRSLPVFQLLHLVGALLLGIFGLVAATSHLGRPLYAFRAILGLRTSWLSREILAFGAFAGLATVYVAVAWLKVRGLEVSPLTLAWLGNTAAAVGIFAVFCSVMIYVDTRRVFWNATATNFKFFLTAAVLGIPTALLISLGAAGWSDKITVGRLLAAYGLDLCRLGVLCSCAKLLYELLIFSRLRDRSFTPLRRTATLMTGVLRRHTLRRFLAGVVGGIVLPTLLVLYARDKPETTLNHPLTASLVAAWLVLTLIGECLERFLFFAAVVAPKMPGSPSS